MPAELLRVNAQFPEADLLRYAAGFLTRGGVIAIPTDTFYGLAADPFNLAAVDEIYRVKGRPETTSNIGATVQLEKNLPTNPLPLSLPLW